MIKLLIPFLQATDDGFLFVNEKIYTVMVVLLIVFGGILFFLMLLERKAAALEKRLEELEKFKEQS